MNNFFSDHPGIFVGYVILYLFMGTMTASWLQFVGYSVPMRRVGLFFWPFMWLYNACYLIVSCIPVAYKGFVSIFRD